MIRPGDYVQVNHRGVTRKGRVVSVEGGRCEVRIVDDQGSQRVINRAVKDLSNGNERSGRIPVEMSGPRAVGAAGDLTGSPKEAPMRLTIRAVPPPDHSDR